MPAEVVDVAGQSWLPVTVDGQSRYVPAGYVALSVRACGVDDPAVQAESVAAAPMPEDGAAAVEPVSAAPAAAGGDDDRCNLRAAPSTDADVLTVLPPGTAVSIDGEASNGFVPVTGNGVTGWVAVELLQTAAPAAAPVAASDPALPEPIIADAAEAPAASAEAAPDTKRRDSTGIAWPMAGGKWEVVQGYNNGTHTNRSDFAQYKYSLDWARVDGNTAGQTVYAPVSGTIEWVDRGSGGMLINAGNGYGVAMFHVTYDRGYQSGDRVERGEAIGAVSGPGGEGYESMSHIDMTCWRLTQNGHESVPFDGPNAIAGEEFPDIGGGNQHMGATVSP
ncbi:MAG: SH3 domain-containing protein [Thermomicrobiales bacterium]